jgi:glutaredoxin
MNTFESIFLDLGLSWTLSKLIPYLLMVLLGFIFVYTFHSRIEHKLKKWAFMSLIGLLPFTVYFAIYPIYQGDFSNTFFSPEQLDAFPQEQTLSVVVLPSCPYCHETVSFMNELIKREPSLYIRYVVVAETKGMLKDFRSKLDKRIDVIISSNPKNWITMAHGGFPCMILSQKGKVIHAWENDYFGVRAIDEIIQGSEK